MSGSYTFEEVAKHTEYSDLWIVIDNGVYDLTKFAAVHPAGRNVLKDYAGQDCTSLFKQFHAPSVLHKYKEKLLIGTISNPKPDPLVPLAKFEHSFGELIPYGDSNMTQGWKSPYYDQSHRDLRRMYRSFLVNEIAPNMNTWDDKKILPTEVIKQFADTGLLGFVVGYCPKKYWPKHFMTYKGETLEIENPDYFHEMILVEETLKYSNVGIAWAIGTCSIGLPPVINHGSDFLKDRYISQILKGEKFICLAITEPWVGSDVANLQTTAKLSECGKFYVVNGMKKFITTGAYADVFTAAVRTGDEGFFGVSLLAIERTMPGVKTRKMNMSGVWGSGTAFIIFDNVKVPVEHLIGEEGMGFMYIMQNFNHERYQITIKTVSASRVVYEECMRYAHQRKTFGKTLIEQPVIRQKLALMIKEIDSLQAYTELIAFNMNKKDKRQEKVLAAGIALAKAHGTTIFEKICQDAVQIVGGNGYQRGSVAGIIERYYREAKSLTLGGGAPEVLFDMAVRQASKLMPKAKM